MSAGGSEATAVRPADGAAEDEGQSWAASSLPSAELLRKRKGDAEEERQSLSFHMQEDEEEEGLCRSERKDQQVKMKCFREPHRQIEKRRRHKMNNLIDSLSAMIPTCQPIGKKPDKLTVLRKAVQHLKALKAGASRGARNGAMYKPPILPDEDLRHILLRAADGFLLVVTCDRAKILFISESVRKVLNFSSLELTGQSLFDFIHPKDISKVKEQLSTSETHPQPRLIDAATGVQVQSEVPDIASHLSPGARRTFFCRMKHSPVSDKHDYKRSLMGTCKKKDSYKYCTLHCSGYLRTWPSSRLESEKDSVNMTCLVTVCRVHAHVSHQPSKDNVNVKPAEFVTRCAIDGKFTFVDQQATTFIGYLPQEVLGTSCYEYFHQDDLQHLAEKHRQVLQSKEKIKTRCYRFKTKHGSYVLLQSEWFNFTNPWTKEVEFIVSLNRVVSGPTHTNDEGASTEALQEDTKQIPIIPGLSSGVSTMIYAGSIGLQIANELIDSYRLNSSPTGGASSPFALAQDKGLQVSPHTNKSEFSREETTTTDSQSQSESRTAGGANSAASENTDELSQLDLDSTMMPGLSSFSSDEAALSVIMSLLETDVNMEQTGNFEDSNWPF